MPLRRGRAQRGAGTPSGSPTLAAPAAGTFSARGLVRSIFIRAVLCLLTLHPYSQGAAKEIQSVGSFSRGRLGEPVQRTMPRGAEHGAHTGRPGGTGQGRGRGQAAAQRPAGGEGHDPVGVPLADRRACPGQPDRQQGQPFGRQSFGAVGIDRDCAVAGPGQPPCDGRRLAIPADDAGRPAEARDQRRGIVPGQRVAERARPDRRLHDLVERAHLRQRLPRPHPRAERPNSWVALRRQESGTAPACGNSALTQPPGDSPSPGQPFMNSRRRRRLAPRARSGASRAKDGISGNGKGLRASGLRPRITGARAGSTCLSTMGGGLRQERGDPGGRAGCPGPVAAPAARCRPGFSRIGGNRGFSFGGPRHFAAFRPARGRSISAAGSGRT